MTSTENPRHPMRYAARFALGAVLGVSLSLAIAAGARGDDAWSLHKLRWWSYVSQNPIDDTTTAVIVRDAEDAFIGDRPVQLVVQCESDHTDVLVRWQEFLAIGSQIDVTHRIDREKATTSAWTLSTTGDDTFYPGKPIPFIKRLLASQRLAVRIAPRNRAPITATFQLAGLEDEIGWVERSCHWK